MEQEPDNRDSFATHSVLNYLKAGFQGRFAALNILSQLESPFFQADAIQTTKDQLAKVHHWLEELWKGFNLISASWAEAKTFDAQNAFSMLEALIAELEQSAYDIYQVLCAGQLHEHRDHAGYLLASFGRLVYSRENYIRGLREYAEKFNIEAIKEESAANLEAEKAAIQTVNELLQQMKAQKETVELGFFETLFNLSVELPGGLRAQAHDMKLLLHMFAGGFTYHMADIPEEEEEQWKDAQIDPISAGYWRAYGITAQEVTPWLDVGVALPALAGAWKLRGFTPDTAQPWIDGNFSALEAFRWNAAGLTVSHAEYFQKKDITDPRAVPEEELARIEQKRAEQEQKKKEAEAAQAEEDDEDYA